MKKAIYKMCVNVGRMGELNGVFIAEQEHVKVLVEKEIEVYFGEVLGKHSEICGAIEPHEIKLVSEDESAIKILEELGLENGYNPFDYTFINFDYASIGMTEEECQDMYVSELVKKIIEKQTN